MTDWGVSTRAPKVVPPPTPSRLRELEAEVADLTEAPGERGDWLPVESPRRRPAMAAVPGGRRMPAPEAPKRAAEQPTIRVTIGRIEVRPLEKAPQSAPQPKKVFSLEEYLRVRRREGW